MVLHLKQFIHATPNRNHQNHFQNERVTSIIGYFVLEKRKNLFRLYQIFQNRSSCLQRKTETKKTNFLHRTNHNRNAQQHFFIDMPKSREKNECLFHYQAHNKRFFISTENTFYKEKLSPEKAMHQSEYDFELLFLGHVVDHEATIK